MQLSGYPQDISTVESLFVWAATALDNKKYPAVILNDSITGTPPISLRTGRITASAKFNEPYLRVTADIPLDSAHLNVAPLYLATQELVPDDPIPAPLAEQLGPIGDGSTTETGDGLYSLPFGESDYHFWFRGEAMLQSGFNQIVFNDVLERINGTVQGEDNYVAVFNAQPGFCYVGYSSGYVEIPEITVTEFTIILCAAFHTDSQYVGIFQNSNSPYHDFYVGRNTEIYTHSQYADYSGHLTVDDENLHVYVLTFGSISAEVYLDGILIEQIAASVPGTAISPTTVQTLLHTEDYLYFVSDLVLLNRKATAQEIADSYTAIATHRGLV